MPPSESSIERKIAGFVLILLLAGCLLVLLPFVSATLWAVVLCVASWPLYTRLLSWVGHRRSLAAGLMALVMILVVLMPFVIVGASLGDNVRSFTAAVKQWAASGIPAPPAWLAKVPLIGAQATEQWQTLVADDSLLRARAKRVVEVTTPYMLKAGLALGSGLIQLALSIFVAFFLFRDGAALGERLKSAVDRIGGERGKHLLVVANNTVRGVVYGILGTALAQGILLGIGLVIARVPNAALLALLSFFSSIVPVVGLALVWVPAALWLFAHGSTGMGIFLVIWGIGVSQVDNLLKPYLISKGSAMPFILIFFGVLGGAVTFGFIGVFLGPTLLAVGFRIVEEWNTGKVA